MEASLLLAVVEGIMFSLLRFKDLGLWEWNWVIGVGSRWGLGERWRCA